MEQLPENYNIEMGEVDANGEQLFGTDDVAAPFTFDQLPQELKYRILGYVLNCGFIYIGTGMVVTSCIVGSRAESNVKSVDASDDELEGTPSEESEDESNGNSNDDSEAESSDEPGEDAQSARKLNKEFAAAPFPYKGPQRAAIIADLTALSLVSSQMHEDAIEVFYKTNTFFGLTEDISKFCDLLRHGEVERIRHLCINDDFCDRRFVIYPCSHIECQREYICFYPKEEELLEYAYRSTLQEALRCLTKLGKLQSVTLSWTIHSEMEPVAKLLEKRFKEELALRQRRALDEFEFRIELILSLYDPHPF